MTNPIEQNGFLYFVSETESPRDGDQTIRHGGLPHDYFSECSQDGCDGIKCRKITFTNDRELNKLGVPGIDESGFKIGDKLICTFGNSGNKFWADKLKPFVTVEKII